MTVLITGSTGLIGTYLMQVLKHENRVVALVHNYPDCPSINLALSDTLTVRGDVTDFDLMREIMARYEITEVVHLAAIAKVKTAHIEPYSVYHTNVMGTLAVLEAARLTNVKKVVYMQTDKVYGDKLHAVEDDPYEPSEPYATSKVCAGMMAMSHMLTYGMKIFLLHSVNVFGYDPFSNRIVPNTVKACLRGEAPTIFTNDKSVREYVYVKDVVDALYDLLTDDGVAAGSYNLSTGWIYNQEELVKLMLGFFPGIGPKYGEGNIPQQIQEQSLASNMWSWKPKWTIKDALAETILLFRGNRQEWDRS
jgi:nucleoside-diphosphate-sugar epimerase